MASGICARGPSASCSQGLEAGNVAKPRDFYYHKRGFNAMALALIGTLLPAVTGILDKLIPDANARDKAKAEAEAALLGVLAKADADQIAVNKAEAESGSNFRGGWRPAVGWVCAAALAYQYLARPVLPWLATVAGFNVPPLPALDGSLFELVLAMLGLGGLRTFEKMKGVTR